MRAVKEPRPRFRRRPSNPVLRGIDAFLRLLGFGKTGPGTVPMVAPRTILICNGAHLGDVVLATAVLPVLKDAFPTARIGMVVGSWARVVIAGHPLVEWVHSVDHWLQNRSRIALWRRWWRHLATHLRALKEIRALKYDAAIDLYPTFGNHVLLLWQAGIPTRIAYSAGGLGPLLTHAKDWQDLDQSMVEYHAQLLRELGIGDRSLRHLKSCLPEPTEIEIGKHFRATSNDGYIVLHVGTGLECKEWSLEGWRGVAQQLTQRGFPLVFTGSGQREERHISAIVSGLTRCHNLSGRLSWQESVSVIKHARMVICADSVMAHVAATFDIPCVVIGSGIVTPAHWRPRSPNAVVLMKPVPCSPCYLKQGCPGRECILGVTVDDVMREFDRLIDPQPLSQPRPSDQELGTS